MLNSKSCLLAYLVLELIETHYFRSMIFRHWYRLHGGGETACSHRICYSHPKAQFENLVEALEQVDSLIDGCQARGRELGLDLLEDLFSGRMVLTGGKNPKHGQTLGSDAEIMTLELVKHLLKTLFILIESSRAIRTDHVARSFLLR